MKYARHRTVIICGSCVVGGSECYLDWDFIPSSYFSCSHNLYLLKFRPLHTKKLCHLDNLTRIHKVLRVRTELCHSWSKIAATHALRYFQIEPAFTILLVLQTEFANYHCALPPNGFEVSATASGNSPT